MIVTNNKSLISIDVDSNALNKVYAQQNLIWSATILKISGIISSYEDKKLEKLHVSLFKNNKLIKLYITSTDGYFEFNNLYSGEYTLRIVVDTVENFYQIELIENDVQLNIKLDKSAASTGG